MEWSHPGFGGDSSIWLSGLDQLILGGSIHLRPCLDRPGSVRILAWSAWTSQPKKFSLSSPKLYLDEVGVGKIPVRSKSFPRGKKTLGVMHVVFPSRVIVSRARDLILPSVMALPPFLSPDSDNTSSRIRHQRIHQYTNPTVNNRMLW